MPHLTQHNTLHAHTRGDVCPKGLPNTHPQSKPYSHYSHCTLLQFCVILNGRDVPATNGPPSPNNASQVDAQPLHVRTWTPVPQYCSGRGARCCWEQGNRVPRLAHLCPRDSTLPRTDAHTEAHGHAWAQAPHTKATTTTRALPLPHATGNQHTQRNTATEAETEVTETMRDTETRGGEIQPPGHRGEATTQRQQTNLED